jgi:hypothetical protein
MYLCRDCWIQLRPAARQALNLKDDQARARLRELHRQIDADRNLIDIWVTP